ncbi:uncharacterized protein B0H18DRAFT_1205829 [Fomitopsis serialis]|uniref:uncharacterized protein n=1 Tax=Fomitopsis serialis TaxID=139415 RepID=UPI00200819C2|nr:uncharacterized protein B0H18DRAFT_1205829 [Neoantrodia serialis]KAH9938631.1 hypothetical protein B0H18DRAFT_1205829 [Neoantrodia serialis]
MSQPKKQTATRRNGKSKAAGQRTLFDHFSAISSATGPATSSSGDAGFVGGVEDTQSSDIEIVETVEPSSSALLTDVDALSDTTNEGSDVAVDNAAKASIGKRKPATVRAKHRSKPMLSQGSVPSPGSSQTTLEGQSRDDPIILDSSPIRPVNSNRVSNKPFYSIFASKKAPPTISAPSNSSTGESSLSSRLNKRGIAVPYPARDTQHVRADQTNFSTPPCPFERRLNGARTASQAGAAQLPQLAYGYSTGNYKRQHNESLPGDIAFTSGTDRYPQHEGDSTPVNAPPAACDPGAASRMLTDIPASHKSYPAIERLVNRTQSESNNEASSPPLSQELWTDKWRPRRADEVLGNEDRALYLRAWLLALKLHIETTSASSHDLRGAEGKGGAGKKRQQLLKPRGTKRPQVVRQVDRRKKRRRLDSEEPDDSWIVDDESDDDPGVDEARNDAGKELGWEVFEVYPGIGERSGAALNKLIGDVGKNHIVKQTQRQHKTFFYGNGAAQDPSISVDGEVTQKAGGRKRALKRVDSESGLDEEGSSQTDHTASAGLTALPSEHPPVSQSIVLIEEVDVLYDSDANFWPSMINIIKECRRPVVMTCNDASLVPIADLPLQEILTFTPTAPALATSYLQCVSILEQRPLERSAVSRLYERVGEVPCGYAGSCSTDSPTRCPDLRQALLQLQFGDLDIPTDSPATSARAIPQASGSHDSHSLDIPLEAAQEDLRVIRGQLDDLVDTMTDSGAANDELGYIVLHNDASTELQVPFDTLANPLAAFLDYGPWLRRMVALDDAAEAIYLESQASKDGVRKTRNSLKAVRPVRYVPISESDRRILGAPRTAASASSTISSGTASQPPSAPPPALGPRHSPVTPLAPLEFLQNQRRGSITDPSLHARPSLPAHLANGTPLNNLRPPFRRPSFPSSPSFGPSTLYHDASRPPPGPHRASSPFRFGDASMPPPESSKTRPRRAPRSSSVDAGRRTVLTDSIPELESDVGKSTRDSRVENRFRDSSRAQGSDDMEVDPQEHGQPQERGGGLQRLHAFREPAEVGYNARRHSIAAGSPSLSLDRHSPGWPQGTKRKIPSEQDTPSPGNQEIDPLFAGPGAASAISDEGGGPAPKRRGSAFDTQKIAQLSLNDRRNSRRDSAASSSLSASTPPSAFSGESPHGRPPGGIATFAWPANPQDQAAMHSEANVNMAGLAVHPYDPLTIMPPLAFAPDRRMSVPNLPPENLPTPPSTGPTRVLRSRSRPPSRVRGASQSDPSNVAGPSSGAGQTDEAAAQELHRQLKDGSTPYSRSPELRVSHKLAERKRRKEMKELFDELREHLPADRGMKASKWEILSKAIDFINNLKHTCNEMQREIDMLRHDVETMRHGIPPPYGGGPPPPGVMYGHGPPPVGVPPYPHPGPPHSGPPPPGPPSSSHQPPPPHHVPPPGQPLPPHQHPMHQPGPHPHAPPDDPASRPASSQSIYPPGIGPASMMPPPGPSMLAPKPDPSS